MSVLGIAIALHAELASLGEGALDQGVVTQLDDRVLLVLTGMGPARARISGRRLIDHGATALLSWGTAAALDPALRPGSVLVPTSVIARDGIAIPVDPGWHERVCTRLQRDVAIHRSPVAETAAVLVEPGEKCSLARRRGAIAADMESASLGGVAHECGVPFLVVRAVADDSRMSLPAWLPDTLDELGRPCARDLWAGLLRHPTDLPQLARLARSFRAAMTSLRQIRSHAGAQFLLPT